MKPKYLMVFLLCLLGLCLYLFYMIYSGAKENAIAELNNRQSIHAKQAKSGIEYLFSDLITYLTKVSSSNHIINLDEQGINELGFALNLYPEAITAITRVDKKGRITFTIPYNAAVIGQDISSQKHVKKILRTRKPVISDVFTAVQGYRAIALHVPVFSGNEFHGTRAILINFSTIPKRFLQDIQIGESGYSWMTSKEGIEIYCPVPGHTGKAVFENSKEFPGILSMANLMVEGEEGVASYMSIRIRDQQREMAKHHAVYLPVKIADSFWTIVVVSSENEILASLISLKNKLIMIVCLLLFVSFLFSYSGMKAWGIVREAAKRKKVEKALATHLQNTPIGAISWDLNFKTVEWNPAAENIFGYNREEVIGKHITELILPEDIKELVEGIFQDMLTGKDGDSHSINENITKDGRRIICDWYNTALKDVDGRSIGMASLVNDITERIHTEEALKESEERLKTILSATPDPIVIYSSQGETEYLNPSFVEVFGWTLDELRGKRIPFVPDNQEQITSEKTKELLGSGNKVQFETQRLTKQGSSIDVIISASCIKNLNGKISKLVVILKDITDQKQAKQELKLLNLKLEHEATHDPLTGALNRRAILDILSKELNRAKRRNTKLSIGLCDIDHFKLVNDKYGHQVGDDVLCSFIKAIQNTLRPYDLLGRYGGEEFLLVMPDSTMSAEEGLYERLRAKIADNKMMTRSGGVSITVSIGITSNTGNETIETMIAKADAALYRAKENGRNQLAFAD